MTLIRRHVIGIYVTAALLSGCGGSDPPSGTTDAIRHASALVPSGATARPAVGYKVLYRFGNASADDGAEPAAPLTDVNGTLYGTTTKGGVDGDGTVFSISVSGSEKVIYSFTGGADGRNPHAGLADVNGTLYGTTYYGGDGSCGGCGTVFSISPSGSEKVLHSFTDGSDGGYPLSGLVDVKGKLYGTTEFGGDLKCAGTQPGCGTVYSITTTGSEHVLHRFAGGSDGELPFAGLTDVRGMLYGTTAFGGTGGCGEPCGTVYRITTSGAKKVIYNFGSSGGGTFPHTGLLDVNGVLYGTTGFGGTGCGGGTGYDEGCGVVYSLTTAGKVTVLHNFTGGDSDGAHPVGDLLNVNGTLYGTTFSGGARHKSGTIYSITTSGSEQLVHLFAAPGGGKHPAAGLIEVNGALYGTTFDHGDLGCNRGGKGCGTAFALRPALSP